jgi:hypothetical protein
MKHNRFLLTLFLYSRAAQEVTYYPYKKCYFLALVGITLGLAACQPTQATGPVVLTMPVQVLQTDYNCSRNPALATPMDEPLRLEAEAANGVKATSDGKANIILWRAEPTYPITIKAALPTPASYTIIFSPTLVLTTPNGLSPTIYIAKRGTPCSVIFGEQAERKQTVQGLKTLLVLIVGGLPMVLGLLCLFAGDLAWEFHYWGMRIKGLTPERTDEWEGSRFFFGIMLMLGGIVLGAMVSQIGG